MQIPHFLERGLDLRSYYPGTINVALAPWVPVIRRPKRTLRNVRWAEREPAEDFSFFDCRLVTQAGVEAAGLVYYPHPDTKPKHFQAPDILEILAEWIPDLAYGDLVTLFVPGRQMTFERAPESDEMSGEI